jgi:hypothetical protein
MRLVDQKRQQKRENQRTFGFSCHDKGLERRVGNDGGQTSDKGCLGIHVFVQIHVGHQIDVGIDASMNVQFAESPQIRLVHPFWNRSKQLRDVFIEMFP